MGLVTDKVPKTEEVKESTAMPENTDSLDRDSDIDRVPLKEYFGIQEKYDTGYGDDMDFISRYFKEQGLNEEDMLIHLKKIERRLGAPMPGENRIHRMKHYLSLDAKLTGTLKEMSAFERGWKGMV